MAIARDLLNLKRQDMIVSVPPQATVLEAINLMAANNVGALLVIQEDQITGIISERDIVRKVDRLGKTSATTKVSEIMTEKVLYVNASQPIEECMALMTEKRIRHLPVLDGEQLVGVISIGDVLRNAIAEREFIIAQLEHYIHAGG
ncbi:MAG: CBS domain-containing protein [Anaerolineales bacterium]|jgi:CBS domain-containing protein|nr:CBS domain-containing protein [Anaerolineales bacterium]